MIELISRKAALETVKTLSKRCDTGDISDLTSCLIVAFQDLPTIDPVKHGKWMTEDGKTTVCSSCGDIWGRTDFVLKYLRYCPNCGAKMNVDECGNIVAYRKDGTSVWDDTKNWR